MIIIRDMEKLEPGDSVVILGKFDGFHLGHALLLDNAVKLRKDKMRIVLFTFDIFPYKLINNANKETLPDIAFKTIDSRDERERLWKTRLEGIVDCVVVFPFNRDTMNMEPEYFVREILVKKLGVKCIVAGDDFRFGKARKGDVGVLEVLGEKYGFSVKVVDKVKITLNGHSDPQEISSTLIKQELRKGNMENVTRMLGRPYSISGTVLHGKHLGNKLGFPTANLDIPADKALPPAGVYDAKIHISEQEVFNGISNLGTRPSIDDGDKISMETNIFDFDRDIYGASIQVDLIRFIRPERKFPDLNQLKAQIELDKKEAGARFID